jgi:hypothetical protein
MNKARRQEDRETDKLMNRQASRETVMNKYLDG